MLLEHILDLLAGHVLCNDQVVERLHVERFAERDLAVALADGRAQVRQIRADAARIHERELGASWLRVRQLCIGDDVTQGGFAGRPDYTYRLPLQRMLAALGRKADFIGSQTRGLDGSPWPAGFDPDHEGYYGATTEQIKVKVTREGSAKVWEGVISCDEGRELHAVYPMQSITHNRRLRVEVAVSDADPHLPSIVDVYPMNNWHERETWDFFGIVFDGHPALTRILMPDDWPGHPQRKDYPLGGIPVEYKGGTIPPPDERRAYS